MKQNMIAARRVGLALLGAAMLALVQGCASMELSSPEALSGVTIEGETGKVGQHVVIDVSGYYFLWTVPLVSGDISWNAEERKIEEGFLFFEDKVSIADLQNALLLLAESRNCDLVDVAFDDTDDSFGDLKSIGGLVGALFGDSRMCVSATLVPRK